MPELPELALLAKDLSAIALTGPLKAISFSGPKSFSTRLFPADVRRALRSFIGTRIHIASQGKYLALSSGNTVVSLHLGMTGQFRLETPAPHHKPHHFATFHWPRRRCYVLDFRRFARAQLGLHATSSSLGGFRNRFFLRPQDQLARLVHEELSPWERVPRITWLLRHGRDTGVGNYIANEALGRLRLSPFSPCQSIFEAVRILAACQRVARESFLAGGTSFGIGYYRLNGEKGRYADQLRYYRSKSITRQKFRNRGVYSRFLLPRP